MLLNPIQARLLFAHALENGYAILAVNADSHAAVTDCLEAARQADAPIIIETSLWQLEGHSYGAGDAVLGLTRYLADLAVLADSPPFREVPVLFHTDHIKGPKTLDILGAGIRGLRVHVGDQSVSLHPSTISLDASDFTEDQNIETICTLAAIAEEAGKPVTLEMESEVDEGITSPEVTRLLLGTVEARHPGAMHLYAPGLGTKHGFHAEGYPTFSPEVVRQNVALVAQITGRRFGLALHGSSGLSSEQLTAAAQAGVVKVNWSSASLHLRSTAARSYYETHADRLERGHPAWKATAMDNGVQSYVAPHYVPKGVERIRLLRGTGQASAFRQKLADSGATALSEVN